MIMSNADKNGNLAETGGFVFDPWGNKARIVRAAMRILFIGEWHITEESDTEINVSVVERAKLVEQGYTFEPKPEDKPVVVAPPEGTLVKVFSSTEDKKVRVSTGKLTSSKLLICYDAGYFSGESTCSWDNWEIIK